MSEYKNEKNTRDKIKAHDIIYNQMPEFAHQYFEDRRDLSAGSMLSYAYSLMEFFTYLQDNDYFGGKQITEYTPADFDTLTKEDFQTYFNLKEITSKSSKQSVAKPNTLKRIKACLTSFWTFYIDEEIFNARNPIKSIRLPQIEKKDPVELTKIECLTLFDTVKYGRNLSPKELEAHERCKERDYAIILTFLHTGIRLSELVGIDLTDIRWESHSILINRKGHKEQEVYFSDDVEKALTEYIDVRKEKYWNPSSPPALFLNKFGDRITERSVERMIDKYVRAALPNRKDITCHRFRSTYAQKLLRYSGNLDLVGQALGHENISTTQIYAKTDQDARARVRNFERLS